MQHIRSLLWGILCFFSTLSFGQSDVAATNLTSLYPKMTGDIAYDSTLDKRDFHLCNPDYIFQYFNTSGGLEYEGEKLAIEKVFAAQYKPRRAKKESGWVRIRFVVNCKGETDRFRVLCMDKDYNEKVLHRSITDQLLAVAKTLNGWKTKRYKDTEISFYQYLTFKIKQGRITEILP